MTDTKIIPAKSELAALEQRARDLSEQTKSDATKRAYQSDMRLFVNWLRKNNLSEELPISAECIALYVVHLDKLGRAPSTISRILTAINQAHLLAGLDSPIDVRIREIIKGIRRTRGTAQRQASAITVDHLRRMVTACGGDVLGVRDRALLLVGWTAALRRSELAALTCERLEEHAEGLVINIAHSKTDQEGRGYKIGLPFVDSDLCPVRALRKWLDISRIAEGAIFRRLGKGGRGKLIVYKVFDGLSPKSISLIIKSIAQDAGYDPSQYSAHSLRAGLATAAATAGMAEWQIMKITRHRSEKMVREYIRDGSLFRDHPAKLLLNQ